MVVASPSMFNTSSSVGILSCRFSLFNPLGLLYWRVFSPDQAHVISSVRMANSRPCETPRSCHSSMRQLLDSRNVGQAFLAVSCGHFQLVTICHQLTSLFAQALFLLFSQTTLSPETLGEELLEIRQVERVFAAIGLTDYSF